MADAIAFALLMAVLATAATLDFRTGNVPNRLTYPAMVVGLFFWSVAGFFGHGVGTSTTTVAGLGGAMGGLGDAFLGLLAGAIPFAILFSLNAFGGGDVKVMGVVGAITARWECVLHTTVYALAISVVISLVVMFKRGIVLRTLKRILGAALSFAGGVKPDLDTQSPRIPFVVPVFFGAAVAGIEHMLHLVRFPWTA